MSIAYLTIAVRILLIREEMFTINATIRTEKGKRASRRLRLANKFPAIVYGGKNEPIAIELEQDSIKNMAIKPEFYTENIALILDGKETVIKIQSVQHHPFKLKLIHIDFVYT